MRSLREEIRRRTRSSFRFIFQPLAFSRTLARVTPVHNIIDDLSYNRGNHAMQFGTNIRLVTNASHVICGGL